MFCQNCGADVPDKTEVCLGCGMAVQNVSAAKIPSVNDEWLGAMLLAMFLGIFGAHNFYLKRNSVAIAQLVLGLCSCFIISGIWSLVDWAMIVSGNYRKADGTLLKQQN